MMRLEQVVRQIHRCPALTKQIMVFSAVLREMEQVVRGIHRCPALTRQIRVFSVVLGR